MNDLEFKAKVIQSLSDNHQFQREVIQSLSELKTDVSVLKTDVSVLKNDVSVLKNDVSELKTDVKGLYIHTEDLAHKYAVKRSEMTNMHKWVSSIAEDVELLKKKVA